MGRDGYGQVLGNRRRAGAIGRALGLRGVWRRRLDAQLRQRAEWAAEARRCQPKGR